VWRSVYDMSQGFSVRSLLAGIRPVLDLDSGERLVAMNRSRTAPARRTFYSGGGDVHAEDSRANRGCRICRQLREKATPYGMGVLLDRG
jgi:hypothetical protein